MIPNLTASDNTWHDPRTTQRIQHVITAFVLFGIIIRLHRYLANFPMWADETILAANVRDANFFDLIGPLSYYQVCPILYLWAELAVTKIVGFHEYALRLIPCLCAIASVVLFRRIAGKLIAGVPLLLAVGIFSMSYYPVRYAAEVKPYAMDLFVSLVLISLALGWIQNRSCVRYLWALVIVAPLAIGFSYPSIFIISSIAIALALPVWQSKSWRVTIPYLLAAILISVTFILNYIYIIQPQSAAAADRTFGYWDHGFPSLTNPVRLVVWFFNAHTGRMFGYPIGEARGGSTLSFIGFAVGLWVWHRRSKNANTSKPNIINNLDLNHRITPDITTPRSQTLLLLSPFAVLFIAAVFHKYPYGGSGRITQHMVPAITFFMGIGAAHLFTAFAKTIKQQKRQITLLVTILFVFGIGQTIQSFAFPYRYGCDLEDRNIVQQLWQQGPNDAVMVCGLTDLQLDWMDQAYEFSEGAKYLNHQRIYSTRHQQHQPPNWDQISAARPLRVVTLRWPTESKQATNDEIQRPHPAYQQWRADMDRQYQHVRTINYLTADQRRYRLHHSDGMWIVVDEFIPKPLTTTD